MSVSLYYTARRPQPITPQEQSACEEITARYDAEYPFGELYEGFCIYDPAGNEEDIILDGATKLPSDVDPELCFEIADWWLDCVNEIVSVLTGAQWHVNLDDMDLEWSEEERCFIWDVDN